MERSCELSKGAQKLDAVTLKNSPICRTGPIIPRVAATIWRRFNLLLLATGVAAVAKTSDIDPRGAQFIGFSHFPSFKKVQTDGESILTSREIVTRLKADEVVASWNVMNPVGAYLKCEVRAIYPGHKTKFYNMGLWSNDPPRHPRESVANQKDEDGDVLTDTLVLKIPCEKFQIRLTLGEGDSETELKFLGLSFLDSKATPSALPATRAAWGKLIPVPERSQMLYEGGKSLCSPTTVSMMLSYWSHELKWPELDRDVPDVVKGVYDPIWKGTGNWSFNTAFAGSFKGLRAYVTRLTDLSEVEDWIARGIPVGLSVSYNKLRGIPGPPGGHLVVCVGFTSDGRVILNDPGTIQNVQKTFSRADVIAAWANSRNTVYLVYPENAHVPKDRFGHWASNHSGRTFATQ